MRLMGVVCVSITQFVAKRRMPLGINAAKVYSIKNFQSKSSVVSMVVVVARLLVPRCGSREYLEFVGP